MKVVVFGATGMIGQGVLRECLLDPRVGEVLTVGRKATGRTHETLREIVPVDLYDLSTVEDQLTGMNACFFCLGVSSAGMSQAGYRRITHDLTISTATTLARLNPGMTFIYVSGMGTDVNGRSMWSQVKEGPRTTCSLWTSTRTCSGQATFSRATVSSRVPVSTPCCMW